MKFAYKRLANGIERPIIPVTVWSPATAEIGELIGLDVFGGTERRVSGIVAGETRPYYVHEVEIQIGSSRRRSAIGFMPDLAPNGHGLLGQTGFFDLFSFVKFERQNGVIELGDTVPINM